MNYSKKLLVLYYSGSDKLTSWMIKIRESIKKEKNQIVLKLFQLLAISYMKHFQKDFEELKSLDCMGHF